MRCQLPRSRECRRFRQGPHTQQLAGHRVLIDFEDWLISTTSGLSGVACSTLIQSPATTSAPFAVGHRPMRSKKVQSLQPPFQGIAFFSFSGHASVRVLSTFCPALSVIFSG